MRIHAAKPKRKNQQSSPGGSYSPASLDLQDGRGRDKATQNELRLEVVFQVMRGLNNRRSAQYLFECFFVLLVTLQAHNHVLVEYQWIQIDKKPLAPQHAMNSISINK